MSYSNLLVISDGPFTLGNGFGVTLSTLFEGWPKEKLFQIYRLSNYSATKICTDICEKIVGIDIPGHAGRRYAIPYVFGWRPAWRNKYSKLWLQRKLGKWKPESVYAIFFDPGTLMYAAWVARELNIPLAIHPTDDTRPFRTSRSLNMYFAQAALRIAICEDMQIEYQQRYGCSFEVIHNGVAEELFQPLEKTFSEGMLSIRYLGSLEKSGHFSAIEDIASAVKIFNAGGGAARFELLGGERSKDLALSLTDGTQVVYRERVSRQEGFDLLKTADLLVVPISFDEANFEDMRLSFPTKLPEYLASGTPTLVYGPPGTATVAYCLRHNLGLVQPQRSVEALVKLLVQLSQDPRGFRERAVADQNFARTHFTATVMRKRFQNLLWDMGSANQLSSRLP